MHARSQPKQVNLLQMEKGKKKKHQQAGQEELQQRERQKKAQRAQHAGSEHQQHEQHQQHRQQQSRRMAPVNLPINQVQEQLVPLVRDSQCLILVGETGSGKTTQLPRMLYEAGMAQGMGQAIVVTQPRRVAAVTVAARVAQEMGVPLGGLVGYAVRFDDRTSFATKIKYMTDGLLLREALQDPLLLRYSVVIVDEAHERTVHTDALLGLLKGVQEQRAKHTAEQQQPRHKDLISRKGPGGKPDRPGEATSDRPGEGAAGMPALRLVVMSATLESDKFLRFFSGSRAVHIQGKPYPVEVHYADTAQEDFLDAALIAVLQDLLRSLRALLPPARSLLPPGSQIHLETWESDMQASQKYGEGTNGASSHDEDEGRGNGTDNTLDGGSRAGAPGALHGILVFLPGQEDIEALAALIGERAARLPPGTPPLAVAPIFAALPTEQQMKVFRPSPPGTRKVVLATNIAETSVTIPGIRYVLDSGLVKARVFDPRLGADSLLLIPVSKAQARQRSGRAGREGPGKCFRLYTESTFEGLPESTVPEMRRADVSSLVLQLKALGVHNLLAFPLPDPPPKASLVRAMELLFSLGALSAEGALTRPTGTAMAQLPLEPLYAKALLQAQQFGAVQEVVLLVSLLSVDAPIFLLPKRQQAAAGSDASPAASAAAAAHRRFRHPSGDHLTLLAVGTQFIAEVYQDRAASEAPSSDQQTTDDTTTGAAQGGGNVSPAWNAEEGPLTPLLRGILPGAQRGLGSPAGQHGDGLSPAGLRRGTKWCRQHHLNLRALQRAVHVCRQLISQLQRMGLRLSSCQTALKEEPSGVVLRRCLTSAFFMKAARRMPDGIFRTVQSNQIVSIHPSSVLFEAQHQQNAVGCFIFDQLMRTKNLYARTICLIDESWLSEREAKGTDAMSIKGDK